MASIGCYPVKGVRAIRVAKLVEAGNPDCPLTNGSAFNMAATGVRTDDIISTGQLIERRAGDGTICASFQTPDVVTGMNIEVDVCQFDFEFISVVTGVPVILAGAVTRGVKSLQADQSPAPVQVDIWADRILNGALAPAPYQYMRITLPYVKFQAPKFDELSGDDFATLTLTGIASYNNVIADGAWNDYPESLSERLWAWWGTNDVPDITVSPYTAGCGFLNTPACAS